MSGGDSQDVDALSGLQSQLSSAFDIEDVCPSLTLRDQKLIVVKKSLCTLCAVSERRKLGLMVGNLPANLVLAATFKRPAIAQQVLPEFERVCSLVRS
jgi:hypothetical protein